MPELVDNNREHFNQATASSVQSDFGELIQTVIQEIQTRRQWISSKWIDGDNQVRLLDYACGGGTVSQALMPYITQAVGFDVSENMVAEYNKSAQELGYGPDKMHAYILDLADEKAEVNYPRDIPSTFDIIAISMALHHVQDPSILLRRFAKHLNPGGVCVVVDMVPTPDAPKLEAVLQPDQLEVLKTISKHGFTEEEMRKLYMDAGLGNVEYLVIDRPLNFTMFGHSFSMTGFIARGEYLGAS